MNFHIFILNFLLSAYSLAEAIEPNAHLFFSEALVQYSVNFAAVEDTKDLSEDIEGGKLTGKLLTKGLLSVELLENSENVSYVVSLKGKATSDDQLWKKGAVSVFSSLASDFNVRKIILFTGKGIEVLPAKAEVVSTISVKEGKAGKSTLNVLARTTAKSKTAEKEKAVSERISTALCEQVDHQTKCSLSEGGILFELRNLFGEGSLNMTGLTLSADTTQTHARFHASVEGPVQAQFQPLAQSLAHSPLNEDLRIDLHESAFNNFMQLRKAGKTDDDNHLFKAFKMITANEPYDLRPHDRTDRWDYQYADTDPLKVRFRDQAIHIELNAKSWNRTPMGKSKQAIANGFKVRASYSLAPFDGGLKAKRNSPLSFNYSGTDEEAEFLFAKFDAFLAEEFTFEGLDIPRGSSLERYSALRPSLFESSEGWLRLGWILR